MRYCTVCPSKRTILADGKPLAPRTFTGRQGSLPPAAVSCRTFGCKNQKFYPMVNPKSVRVIMLLLATGLAAFRPVVQPSSFTIKVVNIEKGRGPVVVEIYNEKANWLKKPFRRLTLAPDAPSQTASFAVPPGKYAVSIYQDTNGNGELDMNFLSIPKEPIGFGNNYKPFGQPKFESAVVEYSAAAKPAVIKLFTVF
jgi:uncharacterized protein (DUF2141 family)